MTSWTRIDEEYLRLNLCCGYNGSPTPTEHESRCQGWDFDSPDDLQRVERVLDHLNRNHGDSFRQTLDTKPRYALAAHSVRWMVEKGLPEWRGYVSKSGVLIQLLKGSRTLWWDSAEPLDYYSLYVDR